MLEVSSHGLRPRIEQVGARLKYGRATQPVHPSSELCFYSLQQNTPLLALQGLRQGPAIHALCYTKPRAWHFHSCLNKYRDQTAAPPALID